MTPPPPAACRKCGGADLYPNGRCRPCCRALAKAWKAENRVAVKRQKGRAVARRLAADPAALRVKIADLRREADWLESLLAVAVGGGPVA